jgi:RNA polymerase sigma factor (sigma-70 family)
MGQFFFGAATFSTARASKRSMTRISEIVLPDALVAEARGGDLAALEAVYAATAGPVYTLLRRLVRRPAIAEELLQETFVDVLEHIGAYEGRCPLPSWIRAIAVNRAFMYLRSPWHRGLEWLDKDPGGADRLPAQGAEHSAPLDPALERALMTLPALTRAVVWLHDVEGFTHADIGFALGRTPSFSKSQLSRAHRRLRDLLGASVPLVEVTPCAPS